MTGFNVARNKRLDSSANELVRKVAMNHAFRLSRLKAPRGTITAIILLAVFFLVFGLVVSGASPEHNAAGARYFDNSASTFVNWMLGTLGI